MRYLAPAIVFAMCANSTFAQQWGTMKGQIVWAGNQMPVRQRIDLAKNPQCAAQNPPLKDNILVDPKTKGVKDVLIWIGPEGNAPLAIHPNLRNVPNKEVVIDQPCCLFEPRVSAMRAGQVLIIKNSAGFPHNVHLTVGSNSNNSSLNEMLQAKAEKRFDKDKKLKADPFPIGLSCDIHGHMGGKIGVFDHPYFAVTGPDGTFEIKNLPAGKIRLYMSHDSGWQHTPRESDKEKKIGGRYGQPITIAADKELDFGKMNFKP
jgi:hypothetical protein